jgi:hypothetical protein
MSAGALGTHPLVRGYSSVHYFGRGNPSATWRMAGPLAQLAREVRSPDLILTVAEWVAFESENLPANEDIRHSAKTCLQQKAIVCGTDAVAIDTWAVRNLMMDTPSSMKKQHLDLDDEEAKFTKFLRYYREVYGRGTLDPSLIDVT